MKKKTKDLLKKVILSVSLFGLSAAPTVQADPWQDIVDSAEKQFAGTIQDAVSGTIKDYRSVNNERRAQKVLTNKSKEIAKGVHTRRQIFSAAGLNCENDVNVSSSSNGGTDSNRDNVHVRHNTRTNTNCDDSAYKNVADREVYDDYNRERQLKDWQIRNQQRQVELQQRQSLYNNRNINSRYYQPQQRAPEHSQKQQLRNKIIKQLKGANRYR